MSEKAKSTRGRWTGGPFNVSQTVAVNADLGALLKELYPKQADAATAVREFITLNEGGLKMALEARIKTAKLKAATETLRGIDPEVAVAALKELGRGITTAADPAGIGGDPQGQGKTPGEGE